MSSEQPEKELVDLHPFIREVNLFNFKDYRLYLQALYKQIEQGEPKYSLRRFSIDMGFTGSGYIGRIIKKEKNLAHKGIQKIIKSLNFSRMESEYFQLIVEYCHERNKEAKAKIIERLKSIKKENKKIILEEPLSYFLTNRMCSIVLMLVDYYGEDFRPDPIWIIRRVRIQTNIDEINGALYFLLKKKMLVKVDGRYKNINRVIGTTEDVKSEAIQSAHRQFLKESSDALSFNVNEREFGHITVLINEPHFEKLKLKIKEFRDEIREVANNFSKDNSKDKIAIAINVQLYPVTHKIPKKS